MKTCTKMEFITTIFLTYSLNIYIFIATFKIFKLATL